MITVKSTLGTFISTLGTIQMYFVVPVVRCTGALGAWIGTFGTREPQYFIFYRFVNCAVQSPAPTFQSFNC